MNIIPFIGLDNVKFGCSRDEVRRILGDNWREFRKTPFSSSLTDSYDSHGLHLYYDESNHLEFIEAFSPCEIYYNNIKLLNEKTVTVLDKLQKQSLSGRFDEASWFFDDFGFALIDLEGSITALSIFRKGYYDD